MLAASALLGYLLYGQFWQGVGGNFKNTGFLAFLALAASESQAFGFGAFGRLEISFERRYPGSWIERGVGFASVRL